MQGLYLAAVLELLIALTSLAVEHGLQDTQTSVAVAPDLVASLHVESSWTRDRNCVPCIGTQILNHWTVRKVPSQALLMRSPVTYLLPNPLILSSPWHSMQPATSSFLKPTQSCLTLYDPMDIALQAPLSLEFSRQGNTGVGCHFLLQGIFQTQGSNLGLLKLS